MGMVCGKPGKDEESSKGRNLPRRAQEFQVGRAVYSKREDNYRVQKQINSGEIKIQVVERKGNGSRRVRDDYHVKNKENFQLAVNDHHPGAGTVPKAVQGEQVAAGWPAWLASSAGEAVSGWLPRKADTFEKSDKIGQGTYSSVYKARDLFTNKMVAIKRVRFDSMDVESVKFMAREILILRRLDHPNVIKLEGLITSNTSTTLYLVFEYMDHDLTGLSSLPGSKFTEPQVKCYMKQLLSGLEHCHSRGVLHRDIKGSNLLIDDNGILKIADFGLASFFDRDQNIPLTSRVVTLWYRPPELLLGATHYGTGVDLWSTGCILGELCIGKPIMPGRTEVEQLHKIFKLCGSPSDDYWRKAKLQHTTVFRPQQPYVRRLADTFKDLPAATVGLMDTLLSIDPAHRNTAASALKSQFFSTEPVACDPSSLPKYPPSKEIDAKLRDEAKRQGALGKSQRVEREFRGSKDLQAVPLHETKRGSGQPNSMAQNKLFNLPKDDPASGFQFDTPESFQVVKETRNGVSGPLPRRVAYSGPLGPGAVLGLIQKVHEGVDNTVGVQLRNENEESFPSEMEAVEVAYEVFDETPKPTPTDLQSVSHNTVKIAAHKVFDELTEPVPTGLLSTEASFSVSLLGNEVISSLYTFGTRMADEHEKSYISKLEIVQLWVGEKLMFIFDPGGSFSPKMSCGHLSFSMFSDFNHNGLVFVKEFIILVAILSVPGLIFPVTYELFYLLKIVDPLWQLGPEFRRLNSDNVFIFYYHASVIMCDNIFLFWVFVSHQLFDFDFHYSNCRTHQKKTYILLPYLLFMYSKCVFIWEKTSFEFSSLACGTEIMSSNGYWFIIGGAFWKNSNIFENDLGNNSGHEQGCWKFGEYVCKWVFLSSKLNVPMTCDSFYPFAYDYEDIHGNAERLKKPILTVEDGHYIIKFEESVCMAHELVFGLSLSLKTEEGSLKLYVLECGCVVDNGHAKDFSIILSGGAFWLYQGLVDAFDGTIIFLTGTSLGKYPGQRAIYSYILEDKDVFERVGKDVVLMDTTLEITEMILRLGYLYGQSFWDPDWDALWDSLYARSVTMEGLVQWVQTKRDKNCHVFLHPYPPVRFFKDIFKYGHVLQKKQHAEGLEVEQCVEGLAEISLIITNGPHMRFISTFPRASTLFDILSWRYKLGQGDSIIQGVVKRVDYSSIVALENFVWDPGLVLVSFRFSTLRTRCSFRGGICHDMTFYYSFNCISEFTYLAFYDVIYLGSDISHVISYLRM